MINVITKKVIKDIDLSMQCSLKLELVFYNNHSFLFFSFYKNVEIAIKELKIRYPIFVIEQRDYNLVLGQLFLNLVKFS